MLFSELLEEIAGGRITEGTELMTETGEKAIYSEGTLKWVTANGYESTAVTVNLGNIKGIWKVIDENKTAINFGTGLELLAENYEVTFEMADGEEYKVSSLVDLEEIISLYEALIDIYKADVFADSEDLKDFEEIFLDDYEYELDEYFGEDWLEETLVDTPAEDVTGGNLFGLLDVDTPTDIVDVLEVASAPADPNKLGAKISAEDAFNILLGKRFFGRTVASLADEYGITTRMVYYILDGTYWSDVYDYFEDQAERYSK